MKNLLVLLIAVLTSVTLFSPPTATAAPTDPDDKPTVEMLESSATLALTQGQWKRFSKNLIAALETDHEGVHSSAMRYIIQYSDNLNVSDAVFNVMRIYRDNTDVNRRRMAVVALGSMKSDWAMLFLERSAQFEKSPIVAKTIQDILNARGA